MSNTFYRLIPPASNELFYTQINDKAHSYAANRNNEIYTDPFKIARADSRIGGLTKEFETRRDFAEEYFSQLYSPDQFNYFRRRRIAVLNEQKKELEKEEKKVRDRLDELRREKIKEGETDKINEYKHLHEMAQDFPYRYKRIFEEKAYLVSEKEFQAFKEEKLQYIAKQRLQLEKSEKELRDKIQKLQKIIERHDNGQKTLKQYVYEKLDAELKNAVEQLKNFPEYYKSLNSDKTETDTSEWFGARTFIEYGKRTGAFNLLQGRTILSRNFINSIGDSKSPWENLTSSEKGENREYVGKLSDAILPTMESRFNLQQGIAFALTTGMDLPLIKGSMSTEISKNLYNKINKLKTEHQSSVINSKPEHDELYDSIYQYHHEALGLNQSFNLSIEALSKSPMFPVMQIYFYNEAQKKYDEIMATPNPDNNEELHQKILTDAEKARKEMHAWKYPFIKNNLLNYFKENFNYKKNYDQLETLKNLSYQSFEVNIRVIPTLKELEVSQQFYQFLAQKTNEFNEARRQFDNAHSQTAENGDKQSLVKNILQEHKKLYQEIAGSHIHLIKKLDYDATETDKQILTYTAELMVQKGMINKAVYETVKESIAGGAGTIAMMGTAAFLPGTGLTIGMPACIYIASKVSKEIDNNWEDLEKNNTWGIASTLDGLSDDIGTRFADWKNSNEKERLNVICKNVKETTEQYKKKVANLHNTFDKDEEEFLREMNLALEYALRHASADDQPALLLVKQAWELKKLKTSNPKDYESEKKRVVNDYLKRRRELEAENQGKTEINENDETLLRLKKAQILFQCVEENRYFFLAQAAQMHLQEVANLKKNSTLEVFISTEEYQVGESKLLNDVYKAMQEKNEAMIEYENWVNIYNEWEHAGRPTHNHMGGQDYLNETYLHVLNGYRAKVPKHMDQGIDTPTDDTYSTNPFETKTDTQKGFNSGTMDDSRGATATTSPEPKRNPEQQTPTNPPAPETTTLSGTTPGEPGTRERIQSTASPSNSTQNSLDGQNKKTQEATMTKTENDILPFDLSTKEKENFYNSQSLFTEIDELRKDEDTVVNGTGAGVGLVTTLSGLYTMYRHNKKAQELLKGELLEELRLKKMNEFAASLDIKPTDIDPDGTFSSDNKSPLPENELKAREDFIDAHKEYEKAKKIRTEIETYKAELENIDDGRPTRNKIIEIDGEKITITPEGCEAKYGEILKQEAKSLETLTKQYKLIEQSIPEIKLTPELNSIINNPTRTKGSPVRRPRAVCEAFYNELKKAAQTTPPNEDARKILEEIDNNSKIKQIREDYEKDRPRKQAEIEQLNKDLQTKQAQVKTLKDEIKALGTDAKKTAKINELNELNKNIRSLRTTITNKTRSLEFFNSHVVNNAISAQMHKLEAGVKRVNIIEIEKIEDLARKISSEGFEKVTIDVDDFHTSSARKLAEEIKAGKTADEHIKTQQAKIEERLQKELEDCKRLGLSDDNPRMKKALADLDDYKTIKEGNIPEKLKTKLKGFKPGIAGPLLTGGGLLLIYLSIDCEEFNDEDMKKMSDYIEKFSKSSEISKKNEYEEMDSTYKKSLIEWAIAEIEKKESERDLTAGEQEQLKTLEEVRNNGYNYEEYFKNKKGIELENSNTGRKETTSLNDYVNSIKEGPAHQKAKDLVDIVSKNASIDFFDTLKESYEKHATELEQQDEDTISNNRTGSGTEKDAQSVQDDRESEAQGTTDNPRENDGKKTDDQNDGIPEQQTTPNGEKIFKNVDKIQEHIMVQSSTILSKARELAASEAANGDLLKYTAWVTLASSAIRTVYAGTKYYYAHQRVEQAITGGYDDILKSLRKSPHYANEFKTLLKDFDELQGKIDDLELIEKNPNRSLTENQLKQLEEFKEQRTKLTGDIHKKIDDTNFVKIQSSELATSADDLLKTTNPYSLKAAEDNFIAHLKASNQAELAEIQRRLTDIENKPANNPRLKANRSKAIKELAEQVQAQDHCVLNKQTLGEYKDILKFEGTNEAFSKIKPSSKAMTYANLLRAERAAIHNHYNKFEDGIKKYKNAGKIRKGLRLPKDLIKEAGIGKGGAALFFATMAASYFSIDGVTYSDNQEEAAKKLLEQFTGGVEIQAEQTADHSIIEFLGDTKDAKEKRISIIDWGLARTKNTEEREFLTKLKTKYNGDYGAYLKGEKIILDADKDLSDYEKEKMKLTQTWIDCVDDIVLDNANIKFFTHLKEVREQTEREERNKELEGIGSEGQETGEGTGTDGQNSGEEARTDDQNSGEGAGTDGQNSGEVAGTGGQNSSEGTGTDGQNSDEGAGTDGQNSGEGAGTGGQNSSEGAGTDGQNSGEGAGTDGQNSSNPLAPGTTKGPKRQQPDGQQPQVKQIFPPQSAQRYAESPTTKQQKAAELSEDEKNKLAIMQANAEQNDESWWSRNMSWILTVIGILATAGIAYFFIRKYKKDSDKSKKEADTLKSTVTDLQNKVTDLTKGNEGNSQTTDTQTNIGSTLANNATVVGNASSATVSPNTNNTYSR